MSEREGSQCERAQDEEPIMAELAAACSATSFVVADELRHRGFYAQVQLSLGDVPANLHFSAQAVSPSTVDALLAALRRSVDNGPGRPGPPEPADLSGVDLSTMDDADSGRLLAQAPLLRLFLSVLLTP